MGNGQPLGTDSTTGPVTDQGAMMIDPKTQPKAIWELRRSTHRFLARFAVPFWGSQEDEPHVPPSLEHLHGDKRRKTLARQEARRLSRAALYDFDPTATALAVELGAMLRMGVHARAVMTTGRTSVVDSMDIRPPAPCGFLRWRTGVGYTIDGGAPIIACHWQKTAEGCWIVFWADNHIAAKTMRDRDTKFTPFLLQEYLKYTGPLLYDFPLLMRPAFPRAANQPHPSTPDLSAQYLPDTTVDSETAMVYTLLGTWKAMAMTGATKRTQHEPSRADAMADRRAGVAPSIVTCVSAAEGAVETLQDFLADQAKESGGC